MQLRFARAYARHGNQARAAEEAGYAGDKDSIRQAGYDAARSVAVVNLLDCVTETGGLVDRQELRRVFSRMVRTGIGTDKIRAGEALLKLDELDRRDRE